MPLTPEQHREVAEKAAHEREMGALAQAAPSPQQEKEARDLTTRLMRRRALKQRGLDY